MRIRDLILMRAQTSPKARRRVHAGGQRSTMDQPTMAEVLEQVRRHVRAYLPPEIAEYDNEVIGALAVTISLLASVVMLWLLCGRRRSRGKHLCLLGLSNSGKTLLFMRLVYGQFRETQVSIKENKSSYTLKTKGKSVELVDVPGDERVRQTLFNKYKGSMRAVVVAIDSENFPKEVRGVAELVYDLLLEPAVCKRRTPVLMTCNKQDLPLAKDKMAIKKQLEEEISALKVSRSAKLTSLGSKGRSKATPLGKPGEKFEFSHLPKGVRVEFVSCSARGRGQDREAELDEVTSWIDQYC